MQVRYIPRPISKQLTQPTVLTRRDIDLMDSLCAQTRADLKADPNALEFFNTFSSKENIQKLQYLQQKISEGYEPGGHRVTALRASLLTAGQLLATACSSLFFTHTSRTNIGDQFQVMCF
jgi:hypothetical protein